MGSTARDFGRSMGGVIRTHGRNWRSALSPFAQGTAAVAGNYARDLGNAGATVGGGLEGFAEGLGGEADVLGTLPVRQIGPLSPLPESQAAPTIEAAADRLRAAPQPSMAGGDASDLRAASRRLLEQGAFRASPEWGGDVYEGSPGAGRTLRSAAQMRQDIAAHDLIDTGHEQAMDDIDRAARRRGNPMDDMTAARQRMLQYERTLPTGSTSRVSGSFGQGWGPLSGAEIGGDYNTGEKLGGITTGEEFQTTDAIQRAASRLNPQDRAEGALMTGRGRLAQELAMLREDLMDDVRNGRRSMADADAAWKRASEQARTMAEIMKSGYPPRDPLAVIQD